MRKNWIHISIELANAAFDDPDELPRILEALALLLRDGGHTDEITLRDANGNVVGIAVFSDGMTDDDERSNGPRRA